MPAIALATCAQLPALDPDDALLREALGGDAAVAVWDDPEVDWDAFDLVVLRNTWDYTERRDEFVAWVASLGDRVLNPADVVRWNTDKRYLADLADAGLAVVPTIFLEPASAADGVEAPAVPCVVKPAVSAGSRDTARHDDPEAARAHAAELLAAGRVVMIQPYVAEVDEHGETALVYVEGRLDHAIRKGPLLRGGTAAVEGLFAPEQIAARRPRPEELAVGDAVMAEVRRRFGTLLYARVDLVGERPAVLELELTEPSLFLGFDDGACERLAAAIRRRARGRWRPPRSRR